MSPNFTSQAVVARCSAKKAFLEISENSQENTCDRLCFNKVMCTTVSEYPQYEEQGKLVMMWEKTKFKLWYTHKTGPSSYSSY